MQFSKLRPREAGGLGLLILADVVLAFSSTVGIAALGIALWGLHMGVTQGLLATLVADTAPPELRGTAYGMFNLTTGLALLAAKRECRRSVGHEG